MERLDDRNAFILEHVLDEVLGVIHSKYGKKTAIEAGNRLLQTSIWVLHTGREEMHAAWDAFKKHEALSYTDAA